MLIVLVLAIFQHREAISNYLNPPPDYAAMHDGEVILYATSWCGYCAKARKFLNKHDIAFYEYDIEKSTEGRAQYDSLGGRGVPMLLVNGTVIKGYNQAKIIEALN